MCVALAAPIKSKYRNGFVTIRVKTSDETIQFKMAYLKLSSGISGFIILFITLLVGYAIGEYGEYSSCYNYNDDNICNNMNNSR